MTTVRCAVGALLLAAAAGPGAPSASATPGTGVEARTISQSSVDAPDPGCGFA